MSELPYKIVPLPDTVRGLFLPGHRVTENYVAGLNLLDGHPAKEQLEQAVRTFQSEPNCSPCRGLALGNAGLALLQLERTHDAKNSLSEALSLFEQHGCKQPPSWVQFSRHYAECTAGEGNPVASLAEFERAISLAERLIKECPDFAVDIKLEMAHAQNSLGARLITLERCAEAAKVLRAARDIYREINHQERTGQAEVLTNYALAKRGLGEMTQASLALREALPVAQAGGDEDQVHRIQITMLQLDHGEFGAESYQVLDDAILWALAEDRINLGYLRICIKTQIAIRKMDWATALTAVNHAKELEARLEPGSANPAKLRFDLATVLENLGGGVEKVLASLIEGARMWFDLVSRPQGDGDILATAQGLHDHFRLLSRRLLDEGRIEEACVSLEAGRALGYVLEVDRSSFADFVSKNPFSVDGDWVAVDWLTGIRSTLDHNEVMLVPTVLPPELVSFVISKENVEVVTAEFPKNEEEGSLLISDLHAIPIRLQEGVGLRAVPRIVREFGRLITAQISTKSISMILPNAVFHSVPWRALFRHCGIEWQQLALATGFGLAAYKGAPKSVIPGCSALGFGSAGSIDLNQEAKDFANGFKERGTFVADCASRDIQLALTQQHAVLISCHGDLYPKPDGGFPVLCLHLRDGAKSIDEFLPERVRSELVILSACSSGAYEVAWGDYPAGAAPEVIRRGGRYCIASRCRVGAVFAARFMSNFSERLSVGDGVVEAFSNSLAEAEDDGADLWRDLACFELLGNY